MKSYSGGHPLESVVGDIAKERDAAIARAEAAEKRVAELEAQLRAMMEGEAYGWMRSHPEIDAAIDESFESTVDSTEE